MASSLSHLSQITTLWSVVCQAHQGPEAEQAAARGTLVERYGGAIYRYLMAALKDPEAAEELSQEFALRFVRGDFRNADPTRGRFRHFVKSSLFYLVVKYRRAKEQAPVPLTAAHEPAAPADGFDADAAFLSSWRDELLTRAWAALARHEQESGQPFHAALRLRAERPDASSAELAAALQGRLGRALSSVNYRQILHRARDEFARLLVEEVAHSLDQAGAGEVQEELIDVGLWEYCKGAWAKG